MEPQEADRASRHSVTVSVYLAVFVPILSTLLGAAIGVYGAVQVARYQADHDSHERTVDRRTTAYADLAHAFNSFKAEELRFSALLNPDATDATATQYATPERRQLLLDAYGVSSPSDALNKLNEDISNLRAAQGTVEIVGSERAIDDADNLTTATDLYYTEISIRFSELVAPTVGLASPLDDAARKKLDDEVAKSRQKATKAYFLFVFDAKDETAT